MRTGTQLKVGDTIKCHDADEMIDIMQELEKEGIETDFKYKVGYKKGYWLVITKIRKDKEYD